MKLDAIFELWEADSKIDRTELGEESLKIAQLHHKYFKIFSNERLTLKKLTVDYKRLKLQKYEFYTMGPTEESQALGWELPAQGKILRADATQYVEADKDIVDISLKIGLQEEKLELLESIIKGLNSRGFNIKTALDYLKFTSGVN